MSDKPNILVLCAVLALCVLSFVHVFLFPIYGTKGHIYEARHLAEYEQSLCCSNLRRIKVPRSWHRHCPFGGLVTVAQGGRLGNQIWEYASVWALSRRTGLEPYVPRCIRHTLDKVFAGLSIPPLGYVSHCPLPGHWDRIKNYSESFEDTSPRSIVLPRYVALADMVLAWGDDIRRELTFRPSLMSSSRRILNDARAKLLETGTLSCRSNDTIFVGIHVRRTDYRSYLQRTRKTSLLRPRYFHDAMKHFERKFGDCVAFIVVSDDSDWCERHLKNNNTRVAVVSNSRKYANSAGLDLAILASCNHSIIDYGTFGVWGAILAAGETILYNISQHSSVQVGELLPNWHVIN